MPGPYVEQTSVVSAETSYCLKKRICWAGTAQTLAKISIYNEYQE